MSNHALLAIDRIEAIPTPYGGYVFRSRSEARWAVFFDTLGIEYEYEPRSFDLGPPCGWYLPDFWAPRIHSGSWVEIKGQEPTAMEAMKAVRLCQKTGAMTLLFAGMFDVMPFGKRPEMCNFGIYMVRDGALAPVWHTERYTEFLPGLFAKPYDQIVSSALKAKTHVFGMASAWSFEEGDKHVHQAKIEYWRAVLDRMREEWR